MTKRGSDGTGLGIETIFNGEIRTPTAEAGRTQRTQKISLPEVAMDRGDLNGRFFVTFALFFGQPNVEC
jgi:hypothetical protein